MLLFDFMSLYLFNKKTLKKDNSMRILTILSIVILTLTFSISAANKCCTAKDTKGVKCAVDGKCICDSSCTCKDEAGNCTCKDGCKCEKSSNCKKACKSADCKKSCGDKNISASGSCASKCKKSSNVN